ncbi:MAG: phosphatidylglycerophosphatase A, partial [Pseudomonadota bacterium]
MTAQLVATFLGVGHLRPAPGTWGSLAALPMAWRVMQGGPLLFTAVTAMLRPWGYWATGRVTA